MNENEKIDSIAGTPAKEPDKSQGEDLREKRIKELEAELGKKAKELGDQKEFIDQANVVINTVAYNPELKTKFQEVYQRTYGVSSEQQTEENNKTTDTRDVKSEDSRLSKEVEEIKANTREEKVAEFEQRYGISSLPIEDQKKIRSEIGSYLSEFGQSINTIPLNKLPNLLEKTYMSIKAGELKEEGRLEGFAESRENSYGMMGTIPSGSVAQSSEGITPKQAEIATKLGLDPQKVSETWKKAKENGETS